MPMRTAHLRSLSSGIALLLVAITITFFGSAGLYAQEETKNSSEPGWLTLETGYLTIYYLPGADLNHIENSLRQRASYFSSDIPGEDASVDEKIRYQFDALFRRAEALLDMYPANMHVKIKIFRTRIELNDEYEKIFNAREDFKSFYIYKFNTIYSSEEDISDSIIAHEMGHAIVDHYFAVIPPETVGELLASYVDLHLAE